MFINVAAGAFGLNINDYVKFKDVKLVDYFFDQRDRSNDDPNMFDTGFFVYEMCMYLSDLTKTPTAVLGSQTEESIELQGLQFVLHTTSFAPHWKLANYSYGFEKTGAQGQNNFKSKNILFHATDAQLAAAGVDSTSVELQKIKQTDVKNLEYQTNFKAVIAKMLLESNEDPMALFNAAPPTMTSSTFEASLDSSLGEKTPDSDYITLGVVPAGYKSLVATRAAIKYSAATAKNTSFDDLIASTLANDSPAKNVTTTTNSGVVAVDCRPIRMLIPAEHLRKIDKFRISISTIFSPQWSGNTAFLLGETDMEIDISNHDDQVAILFADAVAPLLEPVGVGNGIYNFEVVARDPIIMDYIVTATTYNSEFARTEGSRLVGAVSTELSTNRAVIFDSAEVFSPKKIIYRAFPKTSEFGISNKFASYTAQGTRMPIALRAYPQPTPNKLFFIVARNTDSGIAVHVTLFEAEVRSFTVYRRTRNSANNYSDRIQIGEPVFIKPEGDFDSNNFIVLDDSTIFGYNYEYSIEYEFNSTMGAMGKCFMQNVQKSASVVANIVRRFDPSHPFQFNIGKAVLHADQNNVTIKLGAENKDNPLVESKGSAGSAGQTSGDKVEFSKSDVAEFMVTRFDMRTGASIALESVSGFNSPGTFVDISIMPGRDYVYLIQPCVYPHNALKAHFAVQIEHKKADGGTTLIDVNGALFARQNRAKHGHLYPPSFLSNERLIKEFFLTGQDRLIYMSTNSEPGKINNLNKEIFPLSLPDTAVITWTYLPFGESIQGFLVRAIVDTAVHTVGMLPYSNDAKNFYYVDKIYPGNVGTVKYSIDILKSDGTQISGPTTEAHLNKTNEPLVNTYAAQQIDSSTSNFNNNNWVANMVGEPSSMSIIKSVKTLGKLDTVSSGMPSADDMLSEDVQSPVTSPTKLAIPVPQKLEFKKGSGAVKMQSKKSSLVMTKFFALPPFEVVIPPFE